MYDVIIRILVNYVTNCFVVVWCAIVVDFHSSTPICLLAGCVYESAYWCTSVCVLVYECVVNTIRCWFGLRRTKNEFRL